MSKYYVSKKRHPILFNMSRCRLSQTDICRALSIGDIRYRQWINDPLLIPGRDLALLAGLFGLPAEELYYNVLHNSAKIDKDGKWYLEDIRVKADKQDFG